jgi:lysophospholipase L1-like esterase
VSDTSIVVAALGDSITVGTPGWDPDPTRRPADADLESQYEFWAAQADPRLAFRNCGVYGERTDEIARRLDDSAERADVLVIQGGINDVAQGRSVDDAAASLLKMVRRGRELGLRVALANVLPWNNGYPRADGEIRRLNSLIDAISRDENLLVCRFYETLEDEARPGLMRDEWTSDGDHPSVEGYRRLGELAFRLP